MRWRESLAPVTMRRVALLAPAESIRDVLVRIAQYGSLQLDGGPGHQQVATSPGPATAILRQAHQGPPQACLSEQEPNIAWCAEHDRFDVVAGEAQLETVASTGTRHGSVVGFLGWARADELRLLQQKLGAAGGAVVMLDRPPGAQPPTLLAPESAGRAFAPLVQTYATVPYRDLDPSLVSGIAYVVMFGMMFADVGHGALLLAGALAVRFRQWRRLRPLRRLWVFLAGAGVSSMMFGGLYGEFFGPTHVIPVVWLTPLDHPLPLLAAAVGVGAVLLAGAYALGTINRLREGGWRVALYAPSGVAGAGLFVGLAAAAGGMYSHGFWTTIAGAAVAVAALVIAYLGLVASAGGGFGGTAQAGIELFDLVVRLGSNLVSFARLAAFGLTHAALGLVVWQSTTGAAHHGVVGIAIAAFVFVVGNVATFSLEALIAGVQALRLEYYELFSRLFITEGVPFKPWSLPIVSDIPTAASHLEVPCLAG